MRRLVLAVALCLLAVTALAREFSDARGRRIAIAAPVTRLVTLAPYLAELVFAAGAGDRLVGVSAYSDYPPAAAELPVVSSSQGLNRERILELAPDLVLAWQSGNREADIEGLEALGTRVFSSEPRSLADIAVLVNRIGELAGTRPVAGRQAAEFLSRIADLRARYARRSPVPVFLQIERRPLMTLAGGHLVNEVLALCGARNVFAELESLAPTVSAEAVLARAPRAVLVASTLPDREAIQAEWRQRLPGAQVRSFEADLLLRHTLRVAEGARGLCAQIQAVREGMRSD
ncbi:MAG: cobalamin-binding protein [Gammaproteobacteria bacterium]|nr:cobalamin-binding protein [Gammaproteobacteria bacterium]